jgi:hypothetical protein
MKNVENQKQSKKDFTLSGSLFPKIGDMDNSQISLFSSHLRQHLNNSSRIIVFLTISRNKKPPAAY